MDPKGRASGLWPEACVAVVGPIRWRPQSLALVMRVRKYGARARPMPGQRPGALVRDGFDGCHLLQRSQDVKKRLRGSVAYVWGSWRL